MTQWPAGTCQSGTCPNCVPQVSLFFASYVQKPHPDWHIFVCLWPRGSKQLQRLSSFIASISKLWVLHDAAGFWEGQQAVEEICLVSLARNILYIFQDGIIFRLYIYARASAPRKYHDQPKHYFSGEAWEETRYLWLCRDSREPEEFFSSMKQCLTLRFRGPVHYHQGRNMATSSQAWRWRS